MDALAAMLIIIFCTPFGWFGMFMFGIMVSMIIEAIHEK